MRILIVDDEHDVKPLFQQRFRREIKSEEIQMDFVYSGEEALEHLKKNGHQNSLILSDINMPGMTGLQLLGQIRKMYAPPPPVIMMVTAYGDQDNRRSAETLGADDFLTKPVDFKLLKEKIKALSL